MTGKGSRRSGLPPSWLSLEERFPDDASRVDYLASLRWPDGARCGACAAALEAAPSGRGWWCPSCRRSSTIIAGTHLAATKVPLADWFRAVAMTSSKGGVSARVLAAELGVDYRTATLMLRRIRGALTRDREASEQSGPLRGQVWLWIVTLTWASTSAQVAILLGWRSTWPVRGGVLSEGTPRGLASWLEGRVLPDQLLFARLGDPAVAMAQGAGYRAKPLVDGGAALDEDFVRWLPKYGRPSASRLQEFVDEYCFFKLDLGFEERFERIFRALLMGTASRGQRP